MYGPIYGPIYGPMHGPMYGPMYEPPGRAGRARSARRLPSAGCGPATARAAPVGRACLGSSLQCAARRWAESQAWGSASRPSTPKPPRPSDPWPTALRRSQGA